MRTPHTTFRRGKRLLLIYRTGEKKIVKYKEKKGKFIILWDNEKVSINEISSLSIFKESNDKFKDK